MEQVPLEQSPYAIAMARIALQIVRIDYKRRKQVWGYPPACIHALALLQRSHGVKELYPFLLDLAKAVQQGIRSDDWLRYEVLRGDNVRMLYKRPFSPRIHRRH